MERNVGSRDAVDPHKHYEQVRYSNAEARNDVLGSANQRGFYDPSSNINANVRPPDYNVVSGATRPVLNFSIQTGEEFALEFMRERVNPRQHNAYSDPGGAPPGYMDLKGILGISNSQSGSPDISVPNPIEKGRAQVDKSYYDSMHSVPGSSSRNDSSLGLRAFASSGASDGSKRKLKLLCSFGGSILPRPSDGKLRFVGGDTRIIQISENISWQELKQKATAIYSQTQTIKYQLPGEDLDALVSVSCDEDLQNMMDECSELDEGGSQKPRMFLFSNNDLEDAQFSLGNVDADSEIKFVVAVNGMDLFSRRNSIPLASASGNNLDNFLNLNDERESGRVVADSQKPLKSSFGTYESDSKNISPLPVLLQQSYGSSHEPNYAEAAENLIPMPTNGIVTQQGGLVEGQVNSVVQINDLDGSAKDVKMKRESSGQKTNEPAKTRSFDKEMLLKEQKMKRDASLPKINETDEIQKSKKEGASSISNHAPREEASISNSTTDSGTLFPTKSNKMLQVPVQSPMPEARKNNKEIESGVALMPGYGGFEGGSTDSTYHETVIPQRVFYSERIPREQAETNRLSKSNDSFGSQFLVAQACSDHSQIAEFVDKLHNVNSTQQSTMSAIEDGLPQKEKYNEYDHKIIKTNPSIPEVGSETNKQKSEQRQGISDFVNDHEAAQIKNNHPFDSKTATGLNHPIETQVASSKDVENSASDFEMTAKKNNGNIAKGDAQLPSREESAVSVGTNPEQGDIFIDINDRFPRDFLSNIFSMAATARDSSSLSGLHGDGASPSLHMENLDPKRWSYFRNLAQDEFVRNDVSLMDQDPLGFSSPLTNIEEGVPPDYNYPPHNFDGHVESHIDFDEDIQRSLSAIMGHNTMDLNPDDSHPQTKGGERSTQDVENLRIQESHYEDKMPEHQNANAPLLDLPVGEFDISTLQVIIKNEDLEELRELGSGTFGTVYHGKWRGSDVAIKRIKKSCFTGRSSEQERLTVEFWREAEILSKLHHPNVLAFYGVVQDGPGGTLATVAEYMVNGSLRHVLLSKERHLDRRKRLIIAMDAAFGMEYLHSKNIVHFDLKCDNLLVNLKDPARPICKVGDFGLSKMKRNTLVTGGVRGTLPWMAPELLNGSSSKVSEKVDVFSFGIVLWEILTGEEPYANMHYGAIIGGIVNNTLRPPVPSFCDTEWKLLMEQCWAPDPVVRPTFTEIARRLRAMSAACQTKPHAHQPQNQAPK
jgi:tRNA A-37 threonylcarbamoyl transferase component Bud32